MEQKAEAFRLVKGNQTTEGDWEDPEGKAEEGEERFKVAIVSMAAELRTVYAKDGEEAAALVAEKDMGRPAGRQGPLIVAVVSSKIDQGSKEPDFLQMVVNQIMAQGAQQAALAQQSQIVKPQLMLPPNFDPKGPAA